MESIISGRRTLIAILSLAGVVGAILGAWNLRRAIVVCRDLYRVDAISLAVEGDLEQDMETSRRALLTALISPDPDTTAASIEEIRASSRRAHETVQHLRSLQPPEIFRLVGQFERSLSDYERVADQIIHRIREHDPAGAIEIERVNGQLSFGSTLVTLRRLKEGVEDHAQVDSSKITQALRYSVLGLVEFGVSTLTILAALAKLSRDRHKALVELRLTNQALAVAKEVEKQRASILELVGSHLPLARTLGAIVELPRKCAVEGGAAIWIANETDIHLQAVAGVSDQIEEVLREYPFSKHHDVSSQLAELARSLSDLAKHASLRILDPGELRDAAGHLIGVVQPFAREDMTDAMRPVARHMEQLAVVAIENTLLYDRLAFQAQHDTLTGLPNRLLFHDRLQQEIRAARRHNTRIAVVGIDLDRYKQINDTLGHQIGDELLVEVGRRLRNCLRETDTVARVGGDEFAVLMTDLRNDSTSELVPSKIMHAIAQPMVLDGHEITVTASVGVSVYPEHGEETCQLIRNADLAMYSAKQSGGNQYHPFRADLGISARRRLEVERELKTALERDEFSVMYQPLMNVGGQLDGLEALLRWTNPAIGDVSPAEFIPIAEEVGLIIPIGEWVTRKACFDAARWLQAGHELSSVAVNLSAVQCVEKGFSAIVERALQDSQLPPAKLEFEITETMLIRNLDRAITNIEYLRNLGVRFSIDDFGTGYSSLSQLRTLPVDCVKIDRSFVKDLELAGNGCTTLVRGIIALAHSLKLKVVAEGVETEEQLEVLRTLGCDISQGFFLHRPMSPAAIEHLLQKGADSTAESLRLLAASANMHSPTPLNTMN